MTTTAPGIYSGNNGNEFHQRTINGVQILVQRNRLGEWFGYVNFLVKKEFDSETQALEWLKSYPMSEV